MEDENSPLSISENDAVVYESGQRRCGPLDGVVDLLPGRGCEVFIAKIPKDITEKDLIPLFRKIGPIYMFRIMMENEHQHRGFGFCTYFTSQTARTATRQLNNYPIRYNWHLGVCISVDNCRLFIGGIPKSRTRDELFTEVARITEDVVDVIMYSSTTDKARNRGFAFVEYGSHKSAAAARRKFICADSNVEDTKLWGQTVAVDWAEPERTVDDEIMAKVKILYFRNLMITTTEDSIFNWVASVTENKNAIDRVKKINDFAFVHLQTRDQAELVLEALNGQVFEGSKVEIHFSKPACKFDQELKKTRHDTLDFRIHNGLDPVDLNGSCDSSLTKSKHKIYRNAAGRCSLKSKSMVKQLNSNIKSVPTDYVSILTQICYQSNWGTPCYSVQLVTALLPSIGLTPVNLCIAQVFIPGLNLSIPSQYGAFSHEEAIARASSNAIQYMLANGIKLPINCAGLLGLSPYQPVWNCPESMKIVNGDYENSSLETNNNSTDQDEDSAITSTHLSSTSNNINSINTNPVLIYPNSHDKLVNDFSNIHLKPN